MSFYASMQSAISLLTSISILMVSCQSSTNETPSMSDDAPKYALVVHGGAGYPSRDNMSDEADKAYRDAINEALDIGENILKNGGSSLDAVESVIQRLENDSLFNAGVGAVFTHEETNSLDASIMDGSSHKAGAVAGVSRIKNPISGARAVMEASKHVMLSGAGADEFAADHNLEMVEPEYFQTHSKLQTLLRVKKSESEDSQVEQRPDWKFGTVGAVALDVNGHIAAGTSTGGMTNKRWGRIGDSPVIGAGTYASDATAGVSCTGHGEYYIRYAVAYDVIAKMKYQGATLESAVKSIVHDELKSVGGAGGLIALDKNGNVAMEFNTSGMFRGYVKPDERVVAIFADE